MGPITEQPYHSSSIAHSIIPCNNTATISYTSPYSIAMNAQDRSCITHIANTFHLRRISSNSIHLTSITHTTNTSHVDITYDLASILHHAFPSSSSTISVYMHSSMVYIGVAVYGPLFGTCMDRTYGMVRPIGYCDVDRLVWLINFLIIGPSTAPPHPIAAMTVFRWCIRLFAVPAWR